MNARQLEKLGVPPDCMPAAIRGIQSAAASGELRSMNVKERIKDVLAAPAAHTADPHFGDLAREVIAAQSDAVDARRPARDRFRIALGATADIDEASHVQMRDACALPMAVGRR